MYFYAGLITFASILITCKLFYKYIRPKFSLKVNCWFCQKNHVVPYGNSNCWDCPYCDQYNGFGPDGDYNKLIPSQHDNLLNTGGNIEVSQLKNAGSENGFCEQCNRDQLLKIKQLAAFEPCNDDLFDEEIDYFQSHLESVYKLCNRCEQVLRRKLTAQNESLRSKVLSWRLQRKPKDQNNRKRNSMFTGRALCVKFLQSFSLGIAFTLILQSLILLASRDELGLSPLKNILSQDLETYIGQLEKHNYVIVALFSLLFSALLAGKQRLRRIDAIGCFAWLVTLFTTLPFLPLISANYQFMAHGLLSVVCFMATLACIVRKYPQLDAGALWQQNTSSNSGYPRSLNLSGGSIRSSVDRDLIGGADGSSGRRDVFRRSLLQDSCISTTSNTARTNRANGDHGENQPIKKDFDLYNDLKAMKIGTPQKCPSLSNIFTTKSYDSTSRFPPPCSPSGVRRNILNPSHLKTKSLTKSSWVAGGYWATSPSGPYGSHSSESHLNLRSKWTFPGTSLGGKHTNSFYGSLSTSFSCPVSREGSTSGDDRLSVFSEPSQRTYRPRIGLTPSSLATFRDSVSPRRNGSLADSGDDDNDSAKSNSSASAVSEWNGRDSERVSAKEATATNDDVTGAQRVSSKGSTAWNRFILSVLGTSLIANSLLAGYFIHHYTVAGNWNS